MKKDLWPGPGDDMVENPRDTDSRKKKKKRESNIQLTPVKDEELRYKLSIYSIQS